MAGNPTADRVKELSEGHIMSPNPAYEKKLGRRYWTCAKCSFATDVEETAMQHQAQPV